MKKDKAIVRSTENVRKTRGSSKPEVMMPVPASLLEIPAGYAAFFAGLKERIARERIKAVLSANSAMVLMYFDIGRSILERQHKEGWGAKVIDRLSHDLKTAFPDMTGFSPRNLKYMRTFADAWPDRLIVQRTVAQLPWRSNLTLLDKLSDPETRLWYAQKALELGMGKDMLAIQIATHLLICCGTRMTSHRLVSCWSRIRTRWWLNIRWSVTAIPSVSPSGKGKSPNRCPMN